LKVRPIYLERVPPKVFVRSPLSLRRHCKSSADWFATETSSLRTPRSASRGRYRMD
jgi:hypothetical protein